MLTKEEVKTIGEKALSFSKFPECEISLTSTDETFIRFALNGLSTSGKTLREEMKITASRDGRTGTTTVSEFTDKALEQAVKRAEALAELSPPDAEHVPPLPAQKYSEHENFPASALRVQNPAMIGQIRPVIESAKVKDLVSAGFIQHTAAANAILNKEKNFGYARTVDARMSVTVRTAAGTSSGWASRMALGVEGLDGAGLAGAAIDKCLRWTNPKRLDPGRYTVVLEPAAVADILGPMRFHLQARAAEEGRSFLSKPTGGTLLGERAFPELITLRSDPQDPRISTTPWSEPRGFAGIFATGGAHGIPAEPTAWIDKGVVSNVARDRYWAAKTNTQPTSAPRNIVLDGSDRTLNDLIASVDKGLLVTRFWYVRLVNPRTVQLTGLTRDGLFLIEGGKVTQPVVNFRFNESPVRVLQNTVALGRSERAPGGGGDGLIVPSLVAKDFLFTSISDAI
jgi:predicted Zn-dependent protease